MEKEGAEAGSLILDTSIFIDLFRNYKPAVDFFSARNVGEFFFSAITETEMLTGSHCNDSYHREQTLHFLGNCKKVIVDNKIACLAGDIRRVYGVQTPDAIIAASAIVTGATLLTKNVKDFDKIKELHVRGPY